MCWRVRSSIQARRWILVRCSVRAQPSFPLLTWLKAREKFSVLCGREILLASRGWLQGRRLRACTSVYALYRAPSFLPSDRSPAQRMAQARDRPEIRRRKRWLQSLLQWCALCRQTIERQFLRNCSERRGNKALQGTTSP